MSAADAGGFWMVDGAPHHAGCVDWSTRPFPYAWALDAGERALRRDPGSGDELARAVAWLRRASTRWKRANHAVLLVSAARAAAVVTAATGAGKGATRDPTPATLGGKR